jgi:hypothetical protein
MAFKHVKGPALLEFYPKTASTTLTINYAARFASGFLAAASAATTRVAGILQVSSSSTDSDFASATKIPVIVPQENDEFEIDLTGTTFTATYLGTQVDIDATGAYVDLSATSHKQVTVLRQGSSTSKIIGKISGAYMFANAT